MLDDERKKQAKRDVARYLEEGLLTKTHTRQTPIQETFLRNAKESLDVADRLQDVSPFWTIVCSYYSMFYIANAALCSIGYKVGGKIAHKVTADALIALIDERLKRSLLADYADAQQEALVLAGIEADELIESFDKERGKRRRIQYETTEEVKRSKAKTSLERAKKFLLEMRRLMLDT